MADYPVPGTIEFADTLRQKAETELLRMRAAFNDLIAIGMQIDARLDLQKIEAHGEPYSCGAIHDQLKQALSVAHDIRGLMPRYHY